MLPFLKKFRKLWMTGLAVGYAMLAVLLWQLPNQKFHIYFLDIGQGDSVLIKTPENHQILIDGGPKNSVIQQLDKVLPFFDKSLDMIVLSHPHADHMDGLIEVLKRYKVDNVLMTGVNYESPNHEEFLKEMREENLRVFIAENHLDFKFGEVVVDVLYPKNELIGKKFDNANNSSIAMKVLHKGKKILLSGDLEKEGEAGLLATGLDLKADIFKAGHHGSRTSSTPEMLKAVKPKVVVIQSGKGNSFGHPHQETLDKFKKLGIKAYRNDEDGMVEFSF